MDGFGNSGWVFQLLPDRHSGSGRGPGPLLKDSARQRKFGSCLREAVEAPG